MENVIPESFDWYKTGRKPKPIEYELDKNGCWNCVSHVPKNKRQAYCAVKRGGVQMLLHRYVFEIYAGRKIGDDLIILHSCDNERCINPEHLSEGTHSDNMKDMMAKGRGKSQFTEGWRTK